MYMGDSFILKLVKYDGTVFNAYGILMCFFYVTVARNWNKIEGKVT